MPNLTNCLWFDTQGEDAANFYTSIFPNSEVKSISRYTDAGPGEAGTVITVSFTLDGTDFMALNGGPNHKFNEAISFVIHCKDQDEVDHYWENLTSDGGEENVCGWLRDKYGLSWQVVPDGFIELVSDPDEERREKAMRAMFTMKKLDLAALRAAVG